MEGLPRLFRDRVHAGQALADLLRDEHQGRRPDAVVLALPRRGVPVAAEVARAFDVELDVVVVRKIGVPGQEELAMGAIASGDVEIRNDALIEMLGISERQFDEPARRARDELLGRERRSAGSGIASGRARPADHRGRRRGGHRGDDAGRLAALRRLDPRRSPSPCRSPRPTPSARTGGRSPTGWCASTSPTRSVRWRARTTTSPRRPTARCAACWNEARERMSRGGG